MLVFFRRLSLNIHVYASSLKAGLVWPPQNFKDFCFFKPSFFAVFLRQQKNIYIFCIHFKLTYPSVTDILTNLTIDHWPYTQPCGITNENDYYFCWIPWVQLRLSGLRHFPLLPSPKDLKTKGHKVQV